MNARRRRPGIRMQVIAGFLFFTAVTVALLWFFQIGLLNTFYKHIKTNEIRAVADQVVDMLYDGAGMTDFVDITNRTNVSILITDAGGNNIAMSPNAQGGALERFSAFDCRTLFRHVQEAGGSVLEDNFPEVSDGAAYEDAQNPMIICAHTVVLPDRGEYLVLLSSSVVPVDSTVETLTVQLQCLTVVMILMGLVLAFIISRRLSRPIERINNAAKYLAHGRYDIGFPAEGAREVAELADTLNYAAGELSKVESLRRELIANVSHDLRTPLTMISGYAEVMRDLPGENTPENVQVIIDESNRLTGLVNDMLDLSKLQSGAQTVSPENYCLTEEIRNVLDRYDKLADYTFRFWCDREVYVYADRLKISQVIYNLVNNAINYTGAEKIVYVRQLVEGNTVRVEITDTGEGIPEDKLPYIWERYYKVDKAHRRAQVGTGLGLSIVKNILDMHRGRYGVMSQVGVGSTFWFELQTAEPAKAEAE